VVILGSTAADGSRVLERDFQRLLQRFQQGAATVHVVMLSSSARSALGGANQTQVGIAAAELTGGRYDNISAASRIATLLPEIAAQIAKSHARQSRQVRITFQRPGGLTGQVGSIGIVGPSNLQLSLSLDGRMP
jgi:hypothetical protein